MNARVICHGCGQVVPLPPGYQRNKIQCSCGVICEVSEAARAAAAAPAPKARRPQEAPPPNRADEEAWAADLLADAPRHAPAEPEEDDEPLLLQPIEDEPPARRREEEDVRDPGDGRPPPRRVRQEVMKFPCRRCRRLIERQGECPYCAADDAPPSTPRLSLDDDEDDEDDGKPYTLDGGNDVSCPKCTNQLPPDSVFCTRCGYDFRRRKKVVKTFQPMSRSWETNYPLERRMSIFLLLQVVGFALGLTYNLLRGGDDWFGFVGSTLLFALLTAFLIGTFDKLELRRDEKGRVTLTKLRRYCFWLSPPRRIEVRGYEGVLTGRSSETSPWEWMIFFILLVGIIPALIWWYYAIHKLTFHVALARDHGHIEEYVYKGNREDQMQEISRTLCDASGLRLLS
jgi:hypothetical protein